MSSPGKKVVISLDDSPNAWYALDWALSNIVQPATDHVVLLSVAQFSDSWKDLAMAAMEMANPLAAAYIPAEYYEEERPVYAAERVIKLEQSAEEYAQRILEKATEIINRYSQKLQGSKISQEIYALKGADVRELIVDFCSANQVDLLIVGSRGLGAMKRTFLGSVSDYCLKNSECPVLVIKMPEDKREQYAHLTEKRPTIETSEKQKIEGAGVGPAETAGNVQK